MTRRISYPSDTLPQIAREIEDGTFEQLEQRWARELPGPEMRISGRGKALDCGAGIGLVTRALRERFCEVIAVEANPDLSPHWFANNDVALYGRATLVPATMIAGPYERRFHVHAREWWKSTTSDGPTTADAPSEVRTIEPRSLASLLLANPEVVAVVMDIEGGEYYALLEALAVNALANVQDIIVELHPGLWPRTAYGRDALIGALGLAGFRMIRNERQPGWPPGTEHPLHIEHLWVTKR